MHPNRCTHQRSWCRMALDLATTRMQPLHPRCQRSQPRNSFVKQLASYSVLQIQIRCIKILVLTPFWARIQKPRYSPAFRIFGVLFSAFSGLVLLRRMTDLVLPQPPRKISMIGSPSCGAPLNAKWASFAARTLKFTTPLLNGYQWYSSASGVFNSVEWTEREIEVLHYNSPYLYRAIRKWYSRYFGHI